MSVWWGLQGVCWGWVAVADIHSMCNSDVCAFSSADVRESCAGVGALLHMPIGRLLSYCSHKDLAGVQLHHAVDNACAYETRLCWGAFRQHCLGLGV